MKTNVIVGLSLLAAGAVIWLGACNSNNNRSAERKVPNGTYSQIKLPQDALATCTVSKDSFNTWFKSGSITENGLVTPANSVTFGHQNNCDFYQWSERMFLWITSTSQEYGGSVMASPVFYNVVSDSSGGLKLEKHIPGIIPVASSRLNKNGPNRHPIYRDKKGRLFEIVFHKPGERTMVTLVTGNMVDKLVELGSIEKDANGSLLVKDKSGKKIEKPQFDIPYIQAKRVLHVFPTSKGTIAVDAFGNIVDAEIDQATLNTLIAQNGSLVYYITMVNDMYAYFLTAVADKAIPGYQFPTTAAERTSIVNYARSKGYPVPSDSNALAMELKTSWVIADSLDHPENYFTMDAMIPTYAATSDTLWKPNGQQKARLALVGIHIVGSVAGHPEMIWATFEHNSNTPNAAYQYIDNKGQVQTVAADKGNWLFNNNAPGDSNNIAYINVDTTNNNLVAVPGKFIAPSNTQRLFPFGTAIGTVPNQQDTSASASNTELISINNAIMNMIPGKDIRKNYVFGGAVWTFGGTAPTGNIYPVDATSGGAIGTSVLANSTMETYFQSTEFTCFTCHSGHYSLQPAALSHIYSNITPLTKMLEKIDKDKKK